MRVERLKYVIWVKDLTEAVRFYQSVFAAQILRQSDVMAELRIADGVLNLHGGGEGKRTWTGLAFQVDDLFETCSLLTAAGGSVLRPPADTPDEPAHLAMCVDPAGNEIMLTKARALQNAGVAGVQESQKRDGAR
jgi:lactoylglutathione lyase